MKQKNLTLLAAALCVALGLPSCAALTRYKCNKEYAAKKGMEDADRGQSSMPQRLDGSSCEGEYSAADYSKDYNFGFQQKKGEVCQLAVAGTLGRTDGEQGLANRPSKTKLSLCADSKNMAKLDGTYEAEFKKSFCAPARATKLGSAQAQAWQPADFETPFKDCTGSKGLKSAYTKAYNDTMKGFCTVAEAEKLGTAEAGARRAPESARARYEHCTSGKTEVLAAFDRAFQSTKVRLEKEDAVRTAAAAEAARKAKIDEFMKTTATSAFPFQLRNYVSRCHVSDDRSFVRVEVENAYPEQVLIQGAWKMSYFNTDFGKITEDRMQEAVLVTGNNKKTFQKLTLPKDASFCRAEFVGQQAGL